MRYLKLFFILCCLPLLADEIDGEIDPISAVIENVKLDENKAESVTVDHEDETPLYESEEEASVDLHQATESYETAFLKTVVALAGLLLLIVLTVWMFKKISRGRLHTFNYHKSIKILDSAYTNPSLAKTLFWDETHFLSIISL